MSDDAMGLTHCDLLMEMREDIRGLKATVDAIAKDQAAGVERRASMQRPADSIYTRLDGHDRDLDRMLAWQNRADGALVLARWALGASLVSRLVSVWVAPSRHFPPAAPPTTSGAARAPLA